MDRKFTMTALIYAIVGLALSTHMARTQNHGQMVTHAHIMLLGFVVSFVYALCHKLWLDNSTAMLAVIQYYVHQVGAVVLLISLFLLYGDLIDPQVVDPVLGVASLLVMTGMILMTVLFAGASRAD